ncbi:MULTISPECIES: hypothetical protein [unclassified Pseudomonas]|uniref:hypothetical protein n=1 Tax=unclassified Pseudomonas TaxID=196821 RepID=UPI00211443AD|nr:MULTISPECIES: hypothetical protein [unclassified Pseudomonas]
MPNSGRNKHCKLGVLTLQALNCYGRVQTYRYLMSLMVMPILMTSTASEDRQPSR